MTSTRFNVGLTDTRNSSRVLRPPGGGHTDIFGVSDPSPPTKNVPEPAVAAPANDEVKNGIEHDSHQEAVQMQENIVHEDSSSPKKSEEETKAPEPPQQSVVAPPRRKRVPPGGYSSGLW